MSLFEYAATCANRDGLCFVHLFDDAPPAYVLMTAERYRALTDRIFGGGEIPPDDPEWLHDHASPEMMAHASSVDDDPDPPERKEPPLLKLDNGTQYRVKHLRLLDAPEGKASAKGGMTVVEIVALDGETVLATGMARCRENENYNRRLGRTIALGRAQKQLRRQPS